MAKFKLSTFITECKRIFKITKKPNKTEYFTVVKVAGLGILVIGLLGFLVLVVKDIIKNMVI